MTTCLDLDIGNSRVKWRIDTRFGCEPLGKFPVVDTVVDRIRVASVAMDQEVLASSLLNQYGISPEFAKSTHELGGVVNGYTAPEQLGVDRWLALVAAWTQYHANLTVFDFGTAVTVDFVESTGVHRGGFIVPAANPMREILSSRTRDVQVHVVTEDASELQPGTDTESAVNRGLNLMSEAWVSRCMSVGNKLMGMDVLHVFTGGGARNFLDRIDRRFIHEPHLVLDGLAVALP